MEVNESRDENEVEEGVSTLEDMNCILDTLDYDFDVTEDLEGMGFGSSKYSDHR
jgi:hypothetical protein